MAGKLYSLSGNIAVISKFIIVTKSIQNIIGGLAGAISLTLLHQAFAKTLVAAPRIDLVGEEALTKTLETVGIDAPEGKDLFNATLGADISSNAAYYTLVGLGNDKQLLMRGALYGLGAGLGALFFTKPLGLDEKPLTKSTQTKVMTVGYYLLGGIGAGVVIKTLRKKSSLIETT